ncbi:MAG TPA: hypothetical protein VLQ93_09020, partial [Myxococcaceae bacterium]|nr:hypothetical protein [Myxococcaceae bacterium]
PSFRSHPTVELPLRGDGPARPSTPAGPTGTQGAEPHAPAQPLEELLPRFDEPIGQESLAHHFSEELRYLGADIRPSRLPPSERAERLWSFFLAYAEANAKDPAGQTQEGRELFRKALAEQGFTGLRDANSGRNGVEVALALLEARSPEELRERLASVRIEPGPERLPSEVSLPVEEHLERPPTERMHTERPPTERMPTERPVAEQQTGQVFDHAEQPHPVPLQAEAPRGVVVPGMVPPGALQAADDGRMEPDGVPAPGHSHRGTNKRLGSHMLWNVLHRFRDSPEFSAVEREKWNQVAFGALLILVGGALMVAMLASL